MPLLPLVIGLLPQVAAAEPPRRDHSLQLDLGLAVVGLAYEHLVERRVAVQLEAQIFGTWFGPIVGLPDLSGYGGQVRPTIFLTDDGARGVYLAPFLRIDRVTKEIAGERGFGVGYSSGIFGGYAFVFGSRFELRVGGGAQFMSYRVRAGGQLASFVSFFPALDLVLGMRF
jgi:hypothetical protein